MKIWKSCGAYFTVEAALVLPLVISAMLLGIYLFCFQYDRCLMEQDMGSLILWCSEARLDIKNTDKEQEEKIKIRTGEIYMDKYVGWELTAVDVKLEKNRISATGRGQLAFPVPGWNMWNGNNLWENKVTYESETISPVFYIRQLRKLDDLLREDDKESSGFP